LHHIAYLPEAQAGADVLSGARDRDIRKTVGLRLYLMMERISTWMAAGTGLLFWVTKTMAVAIAAGSTKAKGGGRVSTDQ
jgi:type IV secretory pathway TrbD component